MNVSCRDVLMKEVSSEEEAMYEIMRYLKVNGLECVWVSTSDMTYENHYTQTFGRTKEVRIGINENYYELFDIRYDHAPPYFDITDPKISEYYLNQKELRHHPWETGHATYADREVFWKDEFLRYVKDREARREEAV